ncbi:MAG: glycosyltransferase family 4 protein [Hyphomicrobiales bacterium]|nr:glycosyltransferase family 4 protein [Hyphomicrobiales bacterium]
MTDGRRIFFLNRFFHPDRSATSQIVSDLAITLAARGMDVRALASRACYDDPARLYPPSEQIAGVAVERLGAGSAGAGLARRAAGYVALHAAMTRRLAQRARRGDIVVVATDPPLLSVSVAPVARMMGLTQINWLQDLYPEVAAGLGVAGLGGAGFGAALKVARDASLRGAAMNVTIGALMRARVESLGVAPERTMVIHNWCDDEAIQPRSAPQLRARWGLEGKFVVGYSGNLGRAHEYQTMLGAAEMLRNCEDIVFLFIGGGYLTEALKRDAAARGLSDRLVFQPHQDLADLPQSLTAPDMHWLSLQPQMEGLIVPSKFYGVASAGRPVIAVSDGDGEVARLVRLSGCGAVVEPGDSAGFAQAVLALRDDAALRAAQGRNGRALIEDAFGRARALAAWEKLLRAC